MLRPFYERHCRSPQKRRPVMPLFSSLSVPSTSSMAVKATPAVNNKHSSTEAVGQMLRSSSNTGQTFHGECHACTNSRGLSAARICQHRPFLLGEQQISLEATLEQQPTCPLQPLTAQRHADGLLPAPAL